MRTDERYGLLRDASGDHILSNTIEVSIDDDGVMLAKEKEVLVLADVDSKEDGVILDKLDVILATVESEPVRLKLGSSETDSINPELVYADWRGMLDTVKLIVLVVDEDGPVVKLSEALKDTDAELIGDGNAALADCEEVGRKLKTIGTEVSATSSADSNSSLDFNSDGDLLNIVLHGTLGTTDVNISVGSSVSISGIIDEDGVPTSSCDICSSTTPKLSDAYSF